MPVTDMPLGIFSKIFPRDTVGEVFAAVRDSGVRVVQFNMTCAGLADMPDLVPAETIADINAAQTATGVEIAAVSGTYNMAHPDPAVRDAGHRALTAVAHAARPIGCDLVTLCTGTRNTGHMWHWDDDNDTSEAWRDMAASFARAVEVADAADVDLAIEPETGNIINSPQRARRLIDDIGSPRIKVIVDVANMVNPGEEARLPRAMADTFDLLADRIVLAHAKDRTATGTVVPAGEGIVPWQHLLDDLDRIGYCGPIVIHGTNEQGAATAIRYLRALGGG